MLGRLLTYARMIRFSHTAFALPFALASYMLATLRYGFLWERFLWIVVAMAGARSAAMMFNRIADRDLDALNPRTRDRELPKGQVSLQEAWFFLIFAVALFVYAAHRLSPLCLALSPVALVVTMGYSFVKRFSWATHLVLGAALGIAPVGAWIAQTGRIHWPAVMLSFAVAAWVAGFDILYACQDVVFDTKTGLYSLPARLGMKRALRISSYLHLLTLLLLLSLYWWLPLGWLYGAGVGIVGALLLAEHVMVTPGDLSKIPTAFFTMNALLSTVYFVFVLGDVVLR
ncbi:MAG: UbiA family prenyltransferase [Acidobacteriota bacterium]|nr:MAG: UbiA family prenyltransferase [Acidobacteriota bacterium]